MNLLNVYWTVEELCTAPRKKPVSRDGRRLVYRLDNKARNLVWDRLAFLDLWMHRIIEESNT